MKKYLSALIMCVLSLILVGCGKKQTLDCTIDLSGQMYGAGTMEANAKFHFEGNSFEKADIKYDVKVTSSRFTDSDMQTLKSNFDEICDSKDLSGIKLSTCTTKLDGKNITLNATIVKKDIENQADTYGSVSATKRDLEKQGYTCKIK